MHQSNDSDHCIPCGEPDSPVAADFSVLSDGEQNATTSDYPPPRAVSDLDPVIFDDDVQPVDNYRVLGGRLAATGDIYRRPDYAGGLLLASSAGNIDPVIIDTGKRLAAIIVDRLRIHVVKGGKSRGSRISSSHLDTMLRTEAFLQQFRPVDAVVRTACYLPDFQVTCLGYNDGGPGMRLLYVGPEPLALATTESITRFLDVMAFATPADRTNAVAAALTVMLRQYWPGGKPVIVVTSSKSHGGKETIIQFAAGTTPKLSISYESTDWALKKSFIATLKQSADAGVINVENARLAKGEKHIASAFLERFLTDPEPVLYSPGTGTPIKTKNHVIVTVSTNFGSVSEDLLNRALPIHLSPVGDVADRKSAIGNPKLDYLPAHREQIEAELRGMIARWIAEGRPLDEEVKHPFSDWARIIGGILLVNGFRGFLTNYATRRTADDPLRKALGLLGAARPGEWLRAEVWAQLAVSVGVVRTVIPEADRESDTSRERGIGVVLSAHQDETFVVDGEDERMVLRLERARRRFEGGEPHTRYRFVVIDREALPEDPTP